MALFSRSPCWPQSSCSRSRLRRSGRCLSVQNGSSVFGNLSRRRCHPCVERIVAFGSICKTAAQTGHIRFTPDTCAVRSALPTLCATRGYGSLEPARERPSWLCQGMNNHRPGYRCSWPDEQRHKILLDPREPASIRLLCTCVIVEDADRRNSVVRRIDHIVGHETFDITDDRNGTLLDPACEFFGHSSLCLALTDSGIHG